MKKLTLVSNQRTVHQMFTVMNILPTPVMILFSYISIAAWLLVYYIEKLQATHIYIEQTPVETDIPFVEADETEQIDLSGNKVFQQIESVVGRFNEELQAANEEWYKTCEELSAETKEEMLLILATVLAILISSYSCVVYVHYISMGFKKV
jgi:hypothetical protein